MHERTGQAKLEIIAGSMFSGKTEELIRRLMRAQIANMNVAVFKPDNDNRWGVVDAICSHSGATFPAIPIPIDQPDAICQLTPPDTDLVAIEEIQFFGPKVASVVQALLDRGVGVLGAGLPSDFRNEPFGSMPVLLSQADGILRLTAICTHSDNGKICGHEATRTQRLVDGEPAKYNDPIILVGASELYAARCPAHHQVPDKPRYF